MNVAVALALLEREGRWLLQLRDDIPTIIAPGCWALFGGHLDPGETPEQALRRELQEEIAWEVGPLAFCCRHDRPERSLHYFHAALTAPLEALELREGQDMALVSLAELETGLVWSPRLQEHRPLAESLRLALPELRRLQALGPT
ncbi:MAG: NUDIX hydrolase [Synechococcaceae cyanobacterium]|nr:NUDIX hydrolase [Synechococcaceae cyanobacterium]